MTTIFLNAANGGQPAQMDANGSNEPRRLLDLDRETIGWLNRLTTEERASLIWAGNLSQEQRRRLDLFLALPKDHFEAGFKIVEFWTRLRWLGATSMKIILAVAAFLVAVNQILSYIAGSGGKP